MQAKITVGVAMRKAFDSVEILWNSVKQIDSVSRVEIFLKFALSAINPYVAVEGERKVSRRVVTCICVIIVGWLSSVTYAVERFSSWDHVDISEKAELAAIALIFGRCVCYAVSVFAIGERLEKNIQQITADRKTKGSSPAAWQLTLDYSKKEFVASMAFISYLAIAAIFILSSPLFMPNQLVLAFNNKIFLLPFDGIFSVNWYLTYLFQCCFGIVVAIFFCYFFSILLHLMNHSCWALDVLMIQVEELRSSSEDYDRDDLESKESVEKKFKESVRSSYSALEWQNEIQKLLKYIFLLDFSLQAIMTGLALAALTDDPKASGVLYGLPLVTLPQLFISCWMAERYTTRIQQLTAAIYDVPWYLMSPKQRKELQIVLIMSQNIQEFNGIFYEVNMETFAGVLNLMYSFFTLLRSMH